MNDGEDLTLKQIHAYIHDFSDIRESESSESLNSIHKLHPVSPPSGQDPNWLSFLQSWSPVVSKVNSRAQSPQLVERPVESSLPNSPNILTRLKETRNQRLQLDLSGKKRKVPFVAQPENKTTVTAVRRVLKDVFGPLSKKNSVEPQQTKNLVFLEKDRDLSIREVEEPSSLVQIGSPERVVKINSPGRIFSRNGMDIRYKLTVLEKLRSSSISEHNSQAFGKGSPTGPSKWGLGRDSPMKDSAGTSQVSKNETPSMTARNKELASHEAQLASSNKNSSKALKTLASKRAQAIFDKKYSQVLKVNQRVMTQKAFIPASLNHSSTTSGFRSPLLLKSTQSKNSSPQYSPQRSQTEISQVLSSRTLQHVPQVVSLEFLSVLEPHDFFEKLTAKLLQRGVSITKIGCKAEVLGETFEYVSNQDGVTFSVVPFVGTLKNLHLAEILAEVCSSD